MVKNFQKCLNMYKIDADCTHFFDCLRLFKNVEVFIKLFMTVHENWGIIKIVQDAGMLLVELWSWKWA